MTGDYGINNLSVGQRVELSPGCDLWARGAKYGKIAGFQAQPRDMTGQNVDRRVIYIVRMEHQRVRKLQRVRSDDLRPV